LSLQFSKALHLRRDAMLESIVKMLSKVCRNRTCQEPIVFIVNVLAPCTLNTAVCHHA